MRGIYAGALSVLAAIDANPEHAESVFRLATQIDITLDSRKQTRLVYDLLKDKRTLALLCSFFTNEYWNRIWIIQEFAIGNPLKLLVGFSLLEVEGCCQIARSACGSYFTPATPR